MRILLLIVLLLLISGPGTLAEESWEQVHGGPDDDYGFCIRTTSDGGFITTGAWSITNRDRQILLLKTDAQGNEEWRELFGDQWSDNGYDVQQTADGGFILTGRVPDDSGLGNLWLVKTDPDGEIQWDYNIGGSGSEQGYSVRQTGDGGFIACGTTKMSVSAEPDIYLVYYRPDEIVPTALVAGPGASPDNPSLVKVFTPDPSPEILAEFTAYGATGYGVNVACGDLTGNEVDEILTGPGPGAIYGPHVRGFSMDGTPLPNFNFIIYGPAVWHFGASVDARIDLDGNGRTDLVVGPGPDPDIPGWIYLYGHDGQQMNFRHFYDNIFPDLGHGTRVASGRR